MGITEWTVFAHQKCTRIEVTLFPQAKVAQSDFFGAMFNFVCFFELNDFMLSSYLLDSLKV